MRYPAARTSNGTPSEGARMTTVTFNSIVDVLEAEFLLGRWTIGPETTLAELGLDSLACREFIHAVEDAFRLCIPPWRLDAPAGYVPIDICREQLYQAAQALGEDFPHSQLERSNGGEP